MNSGTAAGFSIGSASPQQPLPARHHRRHPRTFLLDKLKGRPDLHFVITETSPVSNGPKTSPSSSPLGLPFPRPRSGILRGRGKVGYGTVAETWAPKFLSLRSFARISGSPSLSKTSSTGPYQTSLLRKATFSTESGSNDSTNFSLCPRFAEKTGPTEPRKHADS